MRPVHYTHTDCSYLSIGLKSETEDGTRQIHTDRHADRHIDRHTGR